MNVVADMLLTEPAAAVIWVMLMLLTVPAVLLLSNPDALRSRRPPGGRSPRADEAAYASTFADEIGVAADRAEVGADRWWQHWQHAERLLAEAWQAWLDADERLRASRAAAAFGLPWSVRTCDEYAARERFLHRAVAAAADRGDLPAAAVADALAGRGGWDARLHPLEQELVVDRVAAAYRRQRYEHAVEWERTARHDAELARRAGDSLRREADAAAVRAAELCRAVRVRNRARGRLGGAAAPRVAAA